MRLIKIAKRGPDKVLSVNSWNSASFDSDSRRMKTAQIWFTEYDGVSRFRVDMTREHAESLRANLALWLART